MMEISHPEHEFNHSLDTRTPMWVPPVPMIRAALRDPCFCLEL
jgi:hypothetical protein